MIHGSFQNLNTSLAKEMKDSYEKEVDTFNGNIQPVLKFGFDLNDTQVFEFQSKTERSIYDTCIAELKSAFQTQTNQQLLRQFNEKFKKDENGKQRNWPGIEEEKI